MRLPVEGMLLQLITYVYRDNMDVTREVADGMTSKSEVANIIVKVYYVLCSFVKSKNPPICL